MERRPSATVIAIDGPAGSGKSTLALRLAARLGLPYVNTGLMYRALTLAALREGVDPEDGGALVELAGAITFDLDPRQVPPQLRIDGAPPDPDLLSTQVEGWVSQVSRHTGVRALMRDEQRRLGGAGAVMEGRDIGSVVFPDATLRVLLVAGPQARASRRALEREVAPLPEVRRAIDRRDELDARNVPPLEPDLELDTTHLDADAVFEMVLAAALQRLGEGR